MNIYIIDFKDFVGLYFSGIYYLGICLLIRCLFNKNYNLQCFVVSLYIKDCRGLGRRSTL